MLDLRNLLESIDEDAPSGADLEYDPEFTALAIASQPGEERVVGDTVIRAAEPHYPTVAEAAIALLHRTRDLRVAVILANAALRTGGLEAFEEVLHYIRLSLEDHWGSLYPQLDEDDDADPTMRVNAMLGLVDRDMVLASLRTAALTDSRAFGRFGLRDLQVADSEPASNTADAPTSHVIEAAFQDTDRAYLAALARAMDASLGHVKAIAAVFDERTGSFGPDLEPLAKMLHEIGRRIASHRGAEVSDALDETLTIVVPQQAAPIAVAAMPSAGVSTISSPDDVKKAIDSIVNYYARHEPSSPVPLLLSRARRLVSADFVTIMKDMAPQGVENVTFIGGIKETDD